MASDLRLQSGLYYLDRKKSSVMTSVSDCCDRSSGVCYGPVIW